MPPDTTDKLLQIYVKEANESVHLIKSAIRSLRTHINDQKKIYQLFRGAHTLKSSSYQMGFYTVGYLSSLLCDMLSGIKKGAIKLDDRKLGFIDDFTTSLEESLSSALKKKEYAINPALFQKMDRIIKKGLSEKVVETGIESVERQNQPEALDASLERLYVRTTKKLMAELEQCVQDLYKKNKFEPCIKVIRYYTHIIEGNSLQAGKYLMAYLAAKMNWQIKEIEHSKSVDEIKQAYLQDLLNTMKTHIRCINEEKEHLRPQLLTKLNTLIKHDYDEIEARLTRIIKNERRHAKIPRSLRKRS